MSISSHTPHNPHLQELVDIVACLRGPGGCPWDAEQTHESLVQYLIEETYELVEAIESGDRSEMREELGDVLYQVLFHADIAAASQVDPFTIDDIAADMVAKMVGRHPHVFGDVVAKTAEDVIENWEIVKAQEKKHRTSILDGIPQAMPSLALADKVLGRAQKGGFLREAAAGCASAPCEMGAEKSGGVLGSLLEKQHDYANKYVDADENELGLALLAMVGVAKNQGLDAERALRRILRDVQNEIRCTEVSR